MCHRDQGDEKDGTFSWFVWDENQKKMSLISFHHHRSLSRMIRQQTWKFQIAKWFFLSHIATTAACHWHQKAWNVLLIRVPLWHRNGRRTVEELQLLNLNELVKWGKPITLCDDELWRESESWLLEGFFSLHHLLSCCIHYMIYCTVSSSMDERIWTSWFSFGSVTADSDKNITFSLRTIKQSLMAVSFDFWSARIKFAHLVVGSNRITLVFVEWSVRRSDMICLLTVKTANDEQGKSNTCF